ncbi:MAG: S-methyl-5-thioribose-1-phosphate isomerase, partial [Negativicutes bacterium]|nr:S-methyl-5-thioribose-1-phosphate isomerase [Negativicutes bacterium]
MQALRWDDGTLLLLNQTLLPAKTEWISCTTVERVGEAIQRLETRGAPAIGVAAAFGLVLAAKQSENRDEFHLKANKLKEARPTAVNLMWAIDRLLASTKETSFD